MQALVAAGAHRDLAAELLVAAVRGHAGGHAVVDERLPSATAGEPGAGIGDRRVEARCAAEQLADVGGAKPLRVAGPDHQIRHRTPPQSRAAGGVAAERVVAKSTHSRGEVKRLGAGPRPEERHIHFAVPLGGVNPAGGRLGRQPGGVAGRHHRIRVESAALPAPLETGCEGQGAGGKLEQIAGNIEAEIAQCLIAVVALREPKPPQHLPRDRAVARPLAAEQIERHAAGYGGASVRWSGREQHFAGIVGAMLRLTGHVARPNDVRVPIERPSPQARGAL